MRRFIAAWPVGRASIVLLSLPLLFIHPSVSRSAPPTSRDKAVYERAIAALDQKLSTLRVGMDQLDWPADTPAAIGTLLHGDPQACTAFIRRAVRFEAYRGVLRGPQGTLDAGGGSSADLALLLREMIRANPAAHVRFAVAELSEAQAAALVDAAASAPPERAAIAAKSANQLKATDVAQPASAGDDADPSELWKAMADARIDLNQVRPLIAADSGSNDRAAAISDARQHVWVQVQQGSNWLTLDPSGGLQLPPNAQTMDDVPADWHHNARITVEVERLEEGKLVRETLLEKSWPVD